MLSDTAMPCGEPSDRGDVGFKQFQCRVYKNVFKGHNSSSMECSGEPVY